MMGFFGLVAMSYFALQMVRQQRLLRTENPVTCVT